MADKGGYSAGEGVVEDPARHAVHHYRVDFVTFCNLIGLDDARRSVR